MPTRIVLRMELKGEGDEGLHVCDVDGQVGFGGVAAKEKVNNESDRWCCSSERTSGRCRNEERFSEAERL